MCEALREKSVEVILPEKIDIYWLMNFNDEYAYKDFSATLYAKDWLEQSENELGLGCFALPNASGTDEWSQTITGKILHAKFTSIPKDENISFAPVLALAQANIVDYTGTEHPLAEGRSILVRMDKLLANPVISEA